MATKWPARPPSTTSSSIVRKRGPTASAADANDYGLWDDWDGAHLPTTDDARRRCAAARPRRHPRQQRDAFIAALIEMTIEYRAPKTVAA